jgi:HAD superfamily hydrolase (TIGR01509 family)
LFNAVIFDMDGVIVDSEPLHYESEKYALAQFGLDFPRDVHRKFIGYANEYRFWEALIELFGARVRVEELVKHKNEYFFAHLDHILLIEPAKKLLERIRTSNITIALASSSGHYMINTVLGRFGLLDFFKLIQSGEEVEFGKPHPDIFLKAAERLGIIPSECIVIEDSLNGVMSGKRAGMTVVAVPNEYTKDLDFKIADHVLGSLDEFDSLGLVKLLD